MGSVMKKVLWLTTRLDFPPLSNIVELPPPYETSSNFTTTKKEFPPLNQSPELSSNKMGFPLTYPADSISTSSKMEFPPISQSPFGVHDQQMYPVSMEPPTYGQGVNWDGTNQVAHTGSSNQLMHPSTVNKMEPYPLNPFISCSPNQQIMHSGGMDLQMYLPSLNTMESPGYPNLQMQMVHGGPEQQTHPLNFSNKELPSNSQGIWGSPNQQMVHSGTSYQQNANPVPL